MRRRLDDPTAHFDHLFAHASLAVSIAVALVALTVPSARGALTGATIVGALAAARLLFHPLRLAALCRVYVEGGSVLVAPALGRARAVDVVAVKHDAHSPWPCTLVLADGRRARFVARRDDGSTAFFDVELSDRARYERPRDARDSIASLERLERKTR
jgi:hypothetical protein